MSRVAQKHQMRLIRNLCQPVMSELQYSNGGLAGTQYPLFRLRQWITQADEAGMSWGVLFVDIRHAFDAVNFNTLAA